MLHVVKLCVKRNGISEINADVLVNLPREGIVLFHKRLNLLQLFGGRRARFEFIAARFRQLNHRVLREIFAAYARIAAPFVRHGVFVEIHGHESKLRQPAVDAAVGVDIPHRFAGTHRNAQHFIVAQIDTARKRRHVAVVGHFEGHVSHFLGDIDIHIFDKIAVLLLIHLDKQRRHHYFVIDINARRRNADTIDARHFRRRRLHRRENFVVVIMRILRGFGVPDDFLAIDDFAVDHRAHLSVASARVEPDTAAFQIAAHAHRAIFLRGDFVFLQPGHLEKTLVNAAHEIHVERPRACRRIGFLQPLIDFFASRDGNLITADHPQNRFCKPFRNTEIQFVLAAAVRKRSISVNVIIAAVALRNQNDLRLFAALFYLGVVLLQRLDHGIKIFVQNGRFHT